MDIKITNLIKGGEMFLVIIIGLSPLLLMIVNYYMLYSLSLGLADGINHNSRFLGILFFGSFITIINPYFRSRFKHNDAKNNDGSLITLDEKTKLRYILIITIIVQTLIFAVVAIKSYWFVAGDGDFFNYIDEDGNIFPDNEGLTTVWLNFLNFAGGIGVDLVIGFIAGHLLEEGGLEDIKNKVDETLSDDNIPFKSKNKDSSYSVKMKLNGILYDSSIIEDQVALFDLISDRNKSSISRYLNSASNELSKKFSTLAKKVLRRLHKLEEKSQLISKSSELLVHKKDWENHMQINKVYYDSDLKDLDEIKQSFAKPNNSIGPTIASLLHANKEFLELINEL